MSHPSERRFSTRCDAVKNQSRMEFTVANGTRKTEAQLLNISRGGALIVADDRPPYAAPIWLRIEIPVKTDWVEAIIVRLGQERKIAA